MPMKKSEDFKSYADRYPRPTQRALRRLRMTIKRALPRGVEESIKYGIPTFTYHGNLVHFGAYKSHLGFYPGPTAIEEFKKELAKFEVSKGALRLPLDEPLPSALLTKIVKHCVRERKKKLAAER